MLVHLGREGDGQTHLRTYWVGLGPPFAIKRYEVNDKALLGRSLQQFFKPANAGDKLLSLHRQSSPTFQDYSARNSKGSLLQIVSERLMQHRTAVLRESARETTEPEAFRENVKKMLLDFLPLHACVEAVQKGRRDDAKLYCTMDAFSLLPVVSATAKLTRAIFTVGRLSRAQISTIAKVLLLRSVKPATAHHAISTVLRLGTPGIKLGREVVGLVDPGFQLLSGLNRMAYRIGVVGLQRLSTKIAGVPELTVVAERLEGARQLLSKFYPDGGFWRARPEAVFTQNGRRQVAVGDMRYGVYAIGNTEGEVVAIKEGDHIRLLNPQSGKAYGPPLRRSVATEQLELAPRGNDRSAIASGRSDFSEFGTRLAGLCRVKRAGAPLPASCRAVADIRFGAHGWSLENQAPLINYQIPLTGDAAHAGLGDIRTVNVADRGYEVHYRDAAGLRAIFPDAAARFVHTPGGANGASGTPTLPQTLDGRIVRRPQRGSATPVEFAAFTVQGRDDRGGNVEITRYVPFGTYQDVVRKADGTVVDGAVTGIVYVDPFTPYCFTVPLDEIPLGNGVSPIVLTRPGKAQLDKFNLLQNTMYSDARMVVPGAVSVTRLGDETAGVQAAFDGTCKRAEEILDSALAAMENHPLVVARICAKLLGTQPDDRKLHKLLNAMWTRIADMQHFMPYLESQKANVLGVFQAGGSDSAPLMAGSTRTGSMNQEISFARIKKPLILLNRAHLLDPGISLDSKAATLLHEISHGHDGANGYGGTSDSMNPAAPESVYANYDREKVVLGAISDAASLLGSEPENHADTFAHATMMIAYLIEPGTLDLVKPYLKLSDSYTFAQIKDDFDVLLGLLEGIEFDR